MLVAVWLAERPGAVTAEFRGWRLDTSVGALAVASSCWCWSASVCGCSIAWIVGAPGTLLEGWATAGAAAADRELDTRAWPRSPPRWHRRQKHARKAEKLFAARCRCPVCGAAGC